MLKANLLRSVESILNPADVFKTLLYTGNNASNPLTTGLNAVTTESSVLFGARTGTNQPRAWFDNTRTLGNALSLDSTDGEINLPGFVSWDTGGLTLGADASNRLNASAVNYVLWQFMKANGFFDVVTYTGNGANRTIPHALGDVPGFMVVKRLDSGVSDWRAWHVSLTDASYVLLPRSTSAEISSPTSWNSTAPTNSAFSLGTDVTVNNPGFSYVAYLFGNEGSVIDCGSYTGNGSTTGPVITLGWEPQFVLIKSKTGVAQGWFIFDNARSPANPRDKSMTFAGTTEITSHSVDFLSTGFQPVSATSAINSASATYIYMAIRKA